jgi:hypothetical protein
MGANHRYDEYSKATGFSVDIKPGDPADKTDGAWKAVRGGGIRFVENQGVTTGTEQFVQHSLGQREWEDITLIGPLTSSRKAMMTWYADTVAGKDWRRDVSIIVHGTDSKETHRYEYLHCFLTAYSLTPLDGESEQECEETIEICPATSKNYLG